MRKTLRNPYLPSAVVFLAFVFGFTFLNILTPAKEVSMLERRALAQRPQLTAGSAFSG